MAPFRPTNLNKRAYPGNANVIGPTRQATLGIVTTTSCSSTNVVLGAGVNFTFALGCRYGGCGCPCCNICCSCPATSCTQTVPSGIWSSFEQYEASTRNAWGSGVTTSFGTATCLCCTGLGYTGSGGFFDCKGFFICCGPSTNKWFVSPSCTQVSRIWVSISDAVTVSNSLMGSCGWFVPNGSQLSNPGYTCRTYWDSFSSANYWSNTECGVYYAASLSFVSGGGCYDNKSNTRCVRAFRCTPT